MIELAIELIKLVPWFIGAFTVYKTAIVVCGTKNEITRLNQRLIDLEQKAISQEDYQYLMSSAAKQNMAFQ